MIVSSKVIWDQPQADGRRHVRIVYTDDQKRDHERDSVLDKKADVEALIQERIPLLEAEIASDDAAKEEHEALQSAQLKIAEAFDKSDIKATFDLTDAEVEAVRKG